MRISVPQNAKGYLSILGGFLVQFTLGTLYTFGNMNPYITSYFRKCTRDEDVRTSQTALIFAMAFFGLGFSMYWAGVLERKIGPRWTTLFGAWFMSIGVILTYFTIEVGLIASIFTYGLMFGLGSGIAYAETITMSMAWFPREKGLAAGVVLAGFGGGSIVFDQVETLYINPNNTKPHNISGTYGEIFDEIELLERVPFVFLLIGGIYMTLQLIGALLISKPEERSSYDQEAESLINTQTLPRDLKPYEAVKKRDFWIVWFTVFVNSVSVVIIFTLYKVFGQGFIKDDHFLAVVGSLAAVFNGGGRIIWGRLVDYISYKWLMGILTLSMTVLQLTFAFSGYRSTNYMYLFYVCLLFGGLSGNFALCPAVCSNTFGQKYMASNFGILFTAFAIAGFVGVLMVNTLFDNSASWFGIFSIGAVCSFLGFVCNLFFRGNNGANPRTF